MSKEAGILRNAFLVTTNTSAKNQANRGGSCISGVSVLQKATLNINRFGYFSNYSLRVRVILYHFETFH